MPTLAPVSLLEETAFAALAEETLLADENLLTEENLLPSVTPTAHTAPKPELMDVASASPVTPALQVTHAPKSTPAPKRVFPEMEAPTPEPRWDPRTVTVRAVGDLMAHDKQLRFARSTGTDGAYDFTPQLSYLAESLRSADLTIGNLETTIGRYKNTEFSGYPLFNTPESYLDMLKGAGFDFLTLANNHMLDRYLDGLMQTIDHVERAGFAFGGANRSPEEQTRTNIVEVNGVKLGFLCYTQSTNGMEGHCNKNDLGYAVNYLKNADFAADVARLREAGAEVVIALPHWGDEYARTPNAYQKDTAEAMLDAGVDVILGSHAHVVQPVRTLTHEDASGRERDALIAYSLGNCLSNQDKPYTYAGMILEFTLVEKQNGGFAIRDVGYVPTYCWRTSTVVHTLPVHPYADEPPKDMPSWQAGQMRACLSDLRSVLGTEIRELEK